MINKKLYNLERRSGYYYLNRTVGFCNICVNSFTDTALSLDKSKVHLITPLICYNTSVLDTL